MSSLLTRPEAKEALRECVRDVVRTTLTPPPSLTLPEWADRYRRLALSAGAIGGRWDTSRVEVARGPMMAVTEPGVRTITVKSCTQLMKSALLENIIGYHAHLDPCPILLVQPKDEAVDQFSKERLSPMVANTPVLRQIMGDARTRRSDATMRFKRFPGGFLALASAGSPTNLAMRAIRITLLDEVDKYEPTKEGDPVTLAEERTSTFGSARLCVRACSPVWEETSRIHRSYLESDQRRAFVECPHCGHLQALDFFRHVHWNKGDPTTAAIYCEDCGAAWSEAERLRAITTEGGVQWRQTRPFTCCGVKQHPLTERNWDWDGENQVARAICGLCRQPAVPNGHAGFTASKLYSPFVSVRELAVKWMAVQDDPEGKQTFYNTQLGEAFQVQALRDVSMSGLMGRREVYDVPEGVLVVTAGVDVHPGTTSAEGRIEYELVGWGLGEESWSLDYATLTGDPARQELWDRLDDVLLTPLEREDGAKMVVRAACVDSGGHNTQEAYRFCQTKLRRNVWAVKGANDRGNWSPIWPAVTRNRRQRPGYRPVIIGVSAAKEAVRQRLLINQPGPGYCHFPARYPDAYFDQLTSERLVIEKKAGSMVRRWVLSAGRANEALDCRVYAYAALWGLYHVRRLKLERAVPFAMPDAEEPEAPPAPVPAAAPIRRPAVRKSRWMS